MTTGLRIGPDFETVLAAAQEGAEWAFDRLYRATNPGLIRYLRSYAAQAADDLASETWLGAARNLGRFTGNEDAFGAWLFKIGHRRLIEHWRAASRNASTLARTGALPSYLAPTPEDQIVAADAAVDAATRIVATLSRDQSRVILLRVLGGLSVAQVAEVLGKTEGSVRVLQHKGLRRLAKMNFATKMDFSGEAVTDRPVTTIDPTDAPPPDRLPDRRPNR